MFGIDSNILIHAANQDSDIHVPCRTLLEEWRRSSTPYFIPWSVFYEFLRVSTHPNVFRNPFTADEALGFMESLLASPGTTLLVATNRHPAVLRETLNELPHLRGSVMHDLHVAVLLREHGISQIVTRDLGFHRFPFLTVIDPLR